MNHPQNSKIVRVGAEPLESLLRLIPVEVREELPFLCMSLISSHIANINIKFYALFISRNEVLNLCFHDRNSLWT